MAKDLSTAILDSLHQVGVRHIFGIPGDAINGLVDAARRHEHVDFVTVRHEEAGAFAASAQAKLSGSLGVVAGTAGPGAIHLLNGLYDAKLDGASVLAITGQVDSSLLGTSAQQEVKLGRLFDDVAVFNETVVNPGQMPLVAHNAIREALARNGVTVLVLPADLALAEVESRPTQVIIAPQATPGPPRDEIQRAAELLNESEAVTILVGIGAAGAVSLVLEGANRLQSPIIKSLRAKALVSDEHPLVIGGLGLLGTTAAVEAIERTDVLFMIGTDFPFPDFYPRNARCIQLDIDPTHIGRRNPVDIALVGDAEETLTALVPQLDQRTNGKHLARARDAMSEWEDEMLAAETDDAVPIRPQRLAASIGEHTSPGTIFICDTGAVTAWVARHLKLRQGDRFTLSSSLASMAFGLPGAIGAQLAYPDRPVVALAGDGGFSMLIGDLMTAVELELPLTVVVFNNSKLGLIQIEQEAEGLPEHSTGLSNPDFAEVARAMGAQGWRVEHPDELDGALKSAFDSDSVAVVDVVINPEEVTLPPKVEPRFAFGYARAKLKELIGGQDALSGMTNAAKQAAERVTN